MAADVVICTLGSSILNDLERGQLAGNSELASTDLNSRPALLSLAKRLPESGPLCGAEINCLAQLRRESLLASPASSLELLAQSTDRGDLAAAMVSTHQRRHFQHARVHRVEGLQPVDYEAFRREGLRNLVILTSRLVRDHQDRGARVVLNATGGLKAQVAFAALLGESLGIPVYYRSKEFSRIIALSPMPIAPDVELWIEHSALFYALEEDLLEATDLGPDLDPRLAVLLEEYEGHYLLSPVGELFHQRCRDWMTTRFAAQLPSPRPPSERCAVDIPHHHWPAGFGEFAAMVARDAEFVTRILGSACGHKPLRRPERFKVDLRATGAIEGIWSEDSGNARFLVWTTARDQKELVCAAMELNHRWPM